MFLLFNYTVSLLSPLGKGRGPFNKLKFTSPKDNVFKVGLKLANDGFLEDGNVIN